MADPRSAVEHGARPRALAHPLPAGMRDLLPAEAATLGAVGRAVMGAFELHGYERVVLPAFEYADVLEGGLGTLDPREVLRFVEPESGEVVALRPDVTPQIARLVATRLGDAPAPARLCYEGSVLRRRLERARRQRQIPQAGIELLGRGGLAGDCEVIAVAVAAVRAAGLTDFVLDLGHAGIATALLAGLAPERRAPLVAALAQKDRPVVEGEALALGLGAEGVAALSALADLAGGEELWPRAVATLGDTAAAPAVAELRALADALAPLGVALSVDLGEVRAFDYYTGPTFQILAQGPGRAIASGGRYDGLLARFGAPRAAAGCAVDLENLRWALEPGGAAAPRGPRVLVVGDDADPALLALRAAGVPAAPAPDQPPGGAAALAEYARAWRYTHLLTAAGPDRRLVCQATGRAVPLGDDDVMAALGAAQAPRDLSRRGPEPARPPQEGTNR